MALFARYPLQTFISIASGALDFHVKPTFRLNKRVAL